MVVVDDLSTGNADARTRRGALRPRRHGGRCAGVARRRIVRQGAVSRPSRWSASRWWPRAVLVRQRGQDPGLLEAIRVSGTPRLVFSSTAATYGEPESVPITEDAPTRPTNAYGAHQTGDRPRDRPYATAHGLAATSLRYFNVAGAYAGSAKRHATETISIPLVLQVALGVRRSRCSATIGRPRTAPASATTSMSATWRTRMLALATAQPGAHGIYNLGNGTGSRCGR